MENELLQTRSMLLRTDIELLRAKMKLLRAKLKLLRAKMKLLCTKVKLLRAKIEILCTNKLRNFKLFIRYPLDNKDSRGGGGGRGGQIEIVLLVSQQSIIYTKWLCLRARKRTSPGYIYGTVVPNPRAHGTSNLTRDPRIVQSFKSKCKIAYFKITVLPVQMARGIL